MDFKKVDISTYQSNLALVATEIPQNASSSASLFAKGHAGATPDMQLCAYSKDATIYYDLCYLRFSNWDFLAGDENDERYLPKVENVSAPAAAFDAAVGALLNATAERAAEDASRRFATGEEASGGSVPAIYALAQCTPDMSPAGCRSCLANVIQMAHRFFSGSPTGRFIGVRCNYQYGLYQFFSGAPLLHLPAPASPPVAPPPAQMLAKSTPPATAGGGVR
nr:unnamed protein product [Digitaria exilis]